MNYKITCRDDSQYKLYSSRFFLKIQCIYGGEASLSTILKLHLRVPETHHSSNINQSVSVGIVIAQDYVCTLRLELTVGHSMIHREFNHST